MINHEGILFKATLLVTVVEQKLLKSFCPTSLTCFHLFAAHARRQSYRNRVCGCHSWHEYSKEFHSLNREGSVFHLSVIITPKPISIKPDNEPIKT